LPEAYSTGKSNTKSAPRVRVSMPFAKTLTPVVPLARTAGSMGAPLATIALLTGPEIATPLLLPMIWPLPTIRSVWKWRPCLLPTPYSRRRRGDEKRLISAAHARARRAGYFPMVQPPGLRAPARRKCVFAMRCL
jgi:hypothetical protein